MIGLSPSASRILATALTVALGCARTPGAATSQDAGPGPAKQLLHLTGPDGSPPAIRTAPVADRAGAVTLAPIRVFVAQVKATPDEKEALSLAQGLRAAGVLASVHRADLGSKGLWFRVAVGEWPRKDLFDAQAAALVSTPMVAQAMGLNTASPPPFIALEVPRLADPPKTLIDALEARAGASRNPGASRMAAEEGAPNAFLVSGPGGVLRAVLANTSDNQIVIMDAQGRTLATFEAPAADCEACSGAAGHVHVAWAWNITGTETLEVLLEVGPPGKRAMVLVAAGPRGYGPLVSFPVDMSMGHQRLVSELQLLQLDEDADLELLWSGAALSYLDSRTVCSAQPLEMAHDVSHGPSVRAMDARLHGANGVARHQGGAAEIRTFLKGTWDRTPHLALASALAYLAEAPDDAEIYRDVVARAEQAGREGRKVLQLRALVGLVAARGEWRAGLAPRLHEVLPAAVQETRLLRDHSCADNPLLTGAAAGKAHQEWREALAGSSRRRDVGSLPVADVAMLLDAYPQGSPLVDDIRDLMEFLDVHVPALAEQARALAAARRGGAKLEAVSPERVPARSTPASGTDVHQEQP